MGDVTSKTISDINYMKTTNSRIIRSIAAVTASVAASVMFVNVAYEVSDAIINAPDAIETSVAPRPQISIL